MVLQYNFVIFCRVNFDSPDSFPVLNIFKVISRVGLCGTPVIAL